MRSSDPPSRRVPERTSLARALDVLGLVLDAGDVRADAIAAQLAMPLSTVYRYLRELREAGVIREVAASYGPGPRLADVTFGPTRTTLRRLARPVLERLAAGSGETALVAVRVGIHAVCLDQVESGHARRMAFRVGEVLPLHAGAASRVLLAYAPVGIVAEVLAHPDPITPATPGVADLPRRLAAIRSTGTATSRSELVAGAIAIAVPVLLAGACVASLALAGPDRRGDAGWQRLAKASLEAGRRDLEASLVAG